MKDTKNVKTLNSEPLDRYCPYKGELDWQIECLGAKCMKFDVLTSTCTRT